jgi:hypothetical protein
LSVDTSKLRTETVRKYATVSCNDPRQPTIRLNIHGILRQVIKAAPNAIVLRGAAGSQLSGKFVLTKGTELDITVTDVSAAKNQVTLEGIVEVTAGEKYEITVSAAPALIPGMTRDIINIEVMCSDGEMRSTTVPVTIDHQAPITVIPRGNIVFQAKDTQRLKQPGSAPVKRDLQIFATSPETTFNITNISVDDAPEGVFRITQRKVRNAQRYVVSVEVLESRPERAIRGTLRIQTDLKSMPEVTARLYAQFAVNPTRTPPNRTSPTRTKVKPRPDLQPLPRPGVVKPGIGQVKPRSDLKPLPRPGVVKPQIGQVKPISPPVGPGRENLIPKPPPKP